MSYKNFFAIYLPASFRKLVFLLPVFFYCSNLAVSQTIRYDNSPVDLQLYPRDAADSGNVVINGEILTPGYDSMYVEMYKNDILQRRKSQTLTYSLNKAPFSISQKIHAECSEYKFKIYFNTTLLKTISNVACGDVYLVMGQSNAIEALSDFTYTNEYCRTFGVLTGNNNGDNYNPADTSWAFSEASIGGLTPGKPNVGVWGLQLQKLIKETYNMPTCFINGGRASGFLSIQLRNNSNQEDLTTIYGKLLYRSRKAHITNNIKSIIFYGGESDGYPPGYENYLSNWSIINSQWQENYSGFNKIFTLQVRPGCSSGEELDQLREKQRQLGGLYSNVELFSTSGISTHYGCHYGTFGYIELAGYLIKNISRLNYGGTDTANIRPPNIQRAFYNENKTKIKILFQGSRVQSWPSDTVYGDVIVLNHSMKDYIYLDGLHGNISGGTVSGDTLILNLISPSFATRLSYLPATRDTTDQQVYEGPFLRNPRRLGALSFYNFPIDIISAVELSGLSNSIYNNDVTLNWTTSSEENNSGFKIFRTLKDVDGWQEIGFVEGNGSTTQPEDYSYTDRNLSSGRYKYKIKQVDYNGNFEFFNLINDVVIGVPGKFLLYQNYPNPFNPTTRIEFDLPSEADVNLKLFDMSGKEIRTITESHKAAGYHLIEFNGSSLSSGVYYYTLRANSKGINYMQTRKLVIIK